MTKTYLIGLGVAALVAASIVVSAAQRAGAFSASRDHPAIAYSSGVVSTPATELNRRLEAGETTLTFEPATGYLRAVLEALRIPVESQVLVYSETSFQARRISRQNPRAIYFNEQSAVGWVRGGEVLEIAAQDARQGTQFYTLRQVPAATPRLSRSDNCLSCHLSWETLAVPGPFVMTVLPRRSTDEYANGFHVDHRAPFDERWGGWYVTGAQVPASLGNAPLIQPAMSSGAPRRVPAPRDVTGQFDVAGYLTPYSDVVALLVLDHQTRAANLLTRAGWEYRQAVFEARREPQPGEPLPARALEAVRELSDYLLFLDEAPWPAPIRGSSGFAEAFSRVGPRDRLGRSLRDLQLDTRLLRYPLSFMIYSPGFRGLPAPVREAVLTRITLALSGADRRFAGRVAEADRAVIRTILRDTAPELSQY
ncbi:MAG: hypothetical protein ACT4QD_14325 [Acidobacteriota bacterium]